MNTSTISQIDSSNRTDVTILKVVSLVAQIQSLMATLLVREWGPPAESSQTASALSIERFPRTALFLVRTELEAATSSDEFVALASRARAVRDAEPGLATEAGVVLRRVTARAARCGIHLQNLRRRLAYLGISARAGLVRARPSAVNADSEEVPVTLRSGPRPVHEVEPAASPSESAYPRLAALAAERPLVVFGGRDDRDVIVRLAKETGIDVERVSPDERRPRQIASFAERVRAGRVGAIVLVNAFVTHAAIVPVVAASRLTGTPVAYAGTGGLKKLLRGFDELERQLRVNSGTVAAG